MMENEAAAKPPSSKDLDRIASALRERASSAMAKHDVPAAAIGLAFGDAERSMGLGITNFAHPIEVTPTTMFQIASISKIFTSTTAVILAEKGMLSLTAPIRTYLPDLRLADEECARRITLEDLLSHRAGWPGDFDVDTGRGDDALAQLADVWASAPQWVPLGSQYSYSNLGYGLAGHVIARAAASPFESVVAAEVINPLRLGRTSYYLEDVAFERWAAGHRRGKDGIEHAPWWRPRARGPNGGVLSCVEDLLSFARFHLGDGTGPEGRRLLACESLEDMRRPRIVDTIDTSVGLGWMLHRWAGVDAIAHYGSSYGYVSGLVLFPRTRVALVVLANAGEVGDLVDGILRELLVEAFGVTVPEHAGSALDETEVTTIAGLYEGQNGVLLLRVDETGLRGDIYRDLEAARSGANPVSTGSLVPVDRNTLGIPGGTLVSRYATVVRRDDGTVGFLRAGRRLFRRVESGP